MSFLLFPLVIFGHVAAWVIVFNRLHALPLPCIYLKRMEKVIIGITGAIPIACWYLIATGHMAIENFDSANWLHLVARAYVAFCLFVGTFLLIVWTKRKVTYAPPKMLLSNDTKVVDIAAELGHRPIGRWTTAVFDRIPGSNMFSLATNEKTFALPQLPETLDGLTIAHISDLHFTGRITRDFFLRLTDHVNLLDADIIAVTGDIVEKEHCLDWIPETLGRLECRLGTYFVLGNHDKRIRDVKALRKLLERSGLIDLGGKYLSLDIHGERVLFAGNELPWFGNLRQLTDERPSDMNDHAYRILLSHTPDQIPWARKMGFDLMLAGHTHGGQIRFPFIGPVISPSFFGVKYASGAFFEPPTLIHVSRGISGLQTIRINCLPELTKIVLRTSKVAR